jgi:hypothetical protein
MSRIYTKLFGILLIVVAFFAISAFSVSAERHDNDDQNVWCHHYEGNGTCQENQFKSCNGDWDNGKCPTVTATPTPTPTSTPKVWCHKCDDGKCQEDQKDRCNGDWKEGKCPTTTPTVTPTPTQEVTVTPTPTTDPGTTTSNGGGSDGKSDGRSDGLGCGSHDCSGNSTSNPSQAVLGASTGPGVLGMSTTSGDENNILSLIQVLGSLIMGFTGFKFFRKNA